MSALPSAVSGEPAPLELPGTWYVVVHYVEASRADSNNPEWEDKIWHFEDQGSRLSWKEYSALSFDRDGGRFETLPGGRKIKTLGSWQPNPEQKREIERGLTVDPKWVREKTLRGDSRAGYRSRGRLNHESASVIGMTENWEILDPATHPVFRRVDQLGGGTSVALEGHTVYRTTVRQSTAGPESEIVSGEFSRDGVQTGTFQMWRAGAIRLEAGKESNTQWK